MNFSPESDISGKQSPIELVVSLSAPDMKRVDSYIQSSLKSEVVLINQIANYIVASGGKRLRPMLLTLCAHACGYQGQNHISLAAIIEFIHTATLLHDDVVMSPNCAVASKVRMPYGATRLACWWVIFFTQEAFR